MLLALTGGETVLLVVAGVFIVFALVVSMLVPRRWPEFPGHRVGLFTLAVLILFAGMLTAVVTATGGEEHGGEAAHETESGPSETETAPAETGTEPTETETQPQGGEGNAEAGAAVFASAGCVGCHTLAAANATGTVGPNLDEAKPNYELVVERVTNGKAPMPSFKGQLTEQQIQDVAAYVSENAGS